MKILHIIPTLAKGGAERLVLNICNELKLTKDNQVKLITFRHHNAYPFLTQDLDWEVIPSKVIPSLTGNEIVEIDDLQDAIKAYQPEIIHSHLFETEIVLSKINYSKAKFVVHFHDNMEQFENFSTQTLFNKRKITNFYERRLVLKGYKGRNISFIGISKDTLSFMERTLPNGVLKFHLPNAIDTNRFVPTEKTKSTLHIAMIGSLVDKKGQDLAIQTMAILKKNGISAHLDLLGDGPDLKKLDVLVKNENLIGNVTFHGNVDHPEDYLQQSTVYLHTAKYEPFGLVLLEAMACGLPIVCTDGGGNRDLIQNGINGFLITERDPKLLADKIELIIKDQALQEKMSKNARKFTEEYDIKSYIDRLLKLYKS